MHLESLFVAELFFPPTSAQKAIDTDSSCHLHNTVNINIVSLNYYFRARRKWKFLTKLFQKI